MTSGDDLERAPQLARTDDGVVRMNGQPRLAAARRA
jgi:hypothetical protein